MSSKAIDVNVKVASQFVNELIANTGRCFRFAYQITISNYSDCTVQLLNRHWWIHNNLDEKKEVFGEGVVGQQPILAPQTQFSYTSNVLIDTPTGIMFGVYAMKDENGNTFDVNIPLFILAGENHIH